MRPARYLLQNPATCALRMDVHFISMVLRLRRISARDAVPAKITVKKKKTWASENKVQKFAICVTMFFLQQTQKCFHLGEKPN